MSRWELRQGDALEVLRLLPDASVDALVTDPPSSTRFMGLTWDTDKGGRTQWVAWLAEILAEALRVMKPGAHGLVWALPRTSHWTATAAEDAGFEIRDRLAHAFATGYPKGSPFSKDERFCQCAGFGPDGGRTGSEPPHESHKSTGLGVGDGDLPRGGVHRSMGTRPSSTGGCLPADDSGGGRLPPVAAVDPVSSPSRGCAPVRSHSSESAGGPASESGGSPSRVRYKNRPSSTSSDFLGDSSRPECTRHGSTFDDDASPGAGSVDTSCVEFASGLPECPECGKPIARGMNSALKPAIEDWWLVRKPLVGTLAENVLLHGTGGINVDACRIDGVKPKLQNIGNDSGMWGLGGRTAAEPSSEGRWPANFVLSHHPDCVLVGTRVVETGTGTGGEASPGRVYGKAGSGRSTVAHAPGGTEEVEDWKCEPDCPVRMLDEQSGASRSRQGLPRGAAPGDGWGMTKTGAEYADRGGASRFFFVPKPSSFERDAGLDDLPVRSPGDLTGRETGRPGTVNPRAGASASASGGRRNGHPTVKSVALMRYLVKLITPPGGTVLDCFAGSGTTGCAALLEGFRFVGIEREEEYLTIARARLAYAAQRPIGGEFATGERDEVATGQLPLL